MKLNTVLFTGAVRAVERKEMRNGSSMYLLHVEASEERNVRGQPKVFKTELVLDCFGEAREVAKDLQAGDSVLITGSLQTEYWMWQDRECSKLTVRPSSIVKLPGGVPVASPRESPPRERTERPAARQTELPEDDIPF